MTDLVFVDLPQLDGKTASVRLDRVDVVFEIGSQESDVFLQGRSQPIRIALERRLILSRFDEATKVLAL